jgi:hypothetical protein|tara:strand:- start:628 stop:882 length:255 start_codon:yes stop_codon:yes gene_type:complete
VCAAAVVSIRNDFLPFNKHAHTQLPYWKALAALLRVPGATSFADALYERFLWVRATEAFGKLTGRKACAEGEACDLNLPPRREK